MPRDFKSERHFALKAQETAVWGRHQTSQPIARRKHRLSIWHKVLLVILALLMGGALPRLFQWITS